MMIQIIILIFIALIVVEIHNKSLTDTIEIEQQRLDREELRKAWIEEKRNNFEEFKKQIESFAPSQYVNNRDMCKHDCMICYKNRPYQYMTCYNEEFLQVDLDEMSDTTLEEGVTQLLNRNKVYRPYHTHHDYRSDIRDTLREFTVGEIINTFY